MEVRCAVYDLSRGLARSMGQAVVGVDIEGVWHTGVVVFGKEYFFGGGIQALPEGQFAREFGLLPVQTVRIGSTQRTQEEFHAWLETQKSKFSQNTYDLFHNNCNNFSDACTKFLCGSGIPAHIIELPQRVLNTPMGQLLAPMYQQMTGQIQQHMIPGFDESVTSRTSIEPAPAGAQTATIPTPSPTPSSGGVELTVKISTQEGAPTKVFVESLNATVKDLMRAVGAVSGYAVEDQRIIFKGNLLKDENKSLADCGIQADLVIHMVPKPGKKPQTSPNTSPPTERSPLDVTKSAIDAAFAKMKVANEADQLVAMRTLLKILQNIIDWPLEAKYRKIKQENPALVKRLGSVPGALDSLNSLGFVSSEEDGEKLLVLEASEEAWNKVLIGAEKLKERISALEKPSSSVPAPAPRAPSHFVPPPSFLPGMPDLASLMSNPMVQQQVQQMMSDPAALQSMMSNSPMLRQMTQSNPALAAQMDAVARNPQLVSSLLSDPMMQQFLNNPQMMQNMMQSMGGGSNPGQRNVNAASGANDSQMTEEEMIQEAIRRSLEEK